MSNTTFTKIPVITPYNRGDNLLYRTKYGYPIGTILHNLELFNNAPLQEKYDAFIGIYLFSIISVHMDLIAKPKGLNNAKTFKNKIYIITNTIGHNPIIQELSLLYLKIKLLKENNYSLEDNYSYYKSLDNILNILDDNLIYFIHMILSYNYKVIKDYCTNNIIYDLPKMYETIYPNLVIDLSLILSKIDDNINESFYRFDPKIEFNEYGHEIIPEHHEIFYESTVRNFRNFDEIKEIDNIFCEHNRLVIYNKNNPLDHIMIIIHNFKEIKFKKIFF